MNFSWLSIESQFNFNRISIECSIEHQLNFQWNVSLIWIAFSNELHFEFPFVFLYIGWMLIAFFLRFPFTMSFGFQVNCQRILVWMSIEMQVDLQSSFQMNFQLNYQFNISWMFNWMFYWITQSEASGSNLLLFIKN